MVDSLLFSLDMYTWFILPLFIFLARILDVSLGTVRIVLVTKGLKYFAPIFGFFEVFVWLLAIGQIMKNLTNIFLYVAYAGGFAVGTFVGIQLENRLSLGKVVVRIITRKEASKLIQLLRTHHHTFTVADAKGVSGSVHIIYTIIARAIRDHISFLFSQFEKVSECALIGLLSLVRKLET
jgi:uncharacterized protein YebE (UPF0316 family)